MSALIRKYSYLALSVAVIIAALGVAGYVTGATIISPGTRSIGFGNSGNITVPSQASYELYFTSGHTFDMNSTGPVDIYTYVSNPTSYVGLFDRSALNVTRLVETVNVTGNVYLVVTNPGSANVTVTYLFH